MKIIKCILMALLLSTNIASASSSVITDNVGDDVDVVIHYKISKEYAKELLSDGIILDSMSGTFTIKGKDIPQNIPVKYKLNNGVVTLTSFTGYRPLELTDVLPPTESVLSNPLTSYNIGYKITEFALEQADSIEKENKKILISLIFSALMFLLTVLHLIISSKKTSKQ